MKGYRQTCDKDIQKIISSGNTVFDVFFYNYISGQYSWQKDE